MASNNNTEQIIVQLFADNTVGNITAATLRQFVSAIFQDSEVQHISFQTLNDFEAQDNPKIYEGSLVIIHNSTDAEQGIYYATINQPRERQHLRQLSSNIKDTPGTTTNYDYIANQGQYLFSCNYSEDLVQCFVNGQKIPKSGIQAQTGTSITLLKSLDRGDEVEIIGIVK